MHTACVPKFRTARASVHQVVSGLDGPQPRSSAPDRTCRDKDVSAAYASPHTENGCSAAVTQQSALFNRSYSMHAPSRPAVSYCAIQAHIHEYRNAPAALLGSTLSVRLHDAKAAGWPTHIIEADSQIRAARAVPTPATSRYDPSERISSSDDSAGMPTVAELGADVDKACAGAAEDHQHHSHEHENRPQRQQRRQLERDGTPLNPRYGPGTSARRALGPVLEQEWAEGQEVRTLPQEKSPESDLAHSHRLDNSQCACSAQQQATPFSKDAGRVTTHTVQCCDVAAQTEGESDVLNERAVADFQGPEVAGEPRRAHFPMGSARLVSARPTLSHETAEKRLSTEQCNDLDTAMYPSILLAHAHTRAHAHERARARVRTYRQDIAPEPRRRVFDSADAFRTPYTQRSQYHLHDRLMQLKGRAVARAQVPAHRPRSSEATFSSRWKHTTPRSPDSVLATADEHQAHHSGTDQISPYSGILSKPSMKSISSPLMPWMSSTSPTLMPVLCFVPVMAPIQSILPGHAFSLPSFDHSISASHLLAT